MTEVARAESQLAEAASWVRRETESAATIALVLGSGLGAVADRLENQTRIASRDIPHYPVSSVVGHAGEVVFGTLSGRDIVAISGRVHAYEGHAIREVTFPVRLVHRLGARSIVITNAAGAISRDLEPGDVMLIDDHINLAFANPLVGPVDEGAVRFPDMSAPYDREWLARAEHIAVNLGIRVRRGVYLWTLGPSYETKAEIRAFRRMGADVVGMSTVPEVIQARALDMKVLGLSMITNLAAGLSGRPLSHDDVIEAGREARERLVGFVSAIVRDAT